MTDPKTKKLADLKFAFLSHEVEGTTGFPEAFALYLKTVGARLVHIRFPFFISQNKSIWVEIYQGEKLISRRRSWIRFYQPQLLSFAKDFIWFMTVGWVSVIGSDFVLATSNLMGFAALILRKLGLVKRVTYLVVDYSPQRFSNPIAEKIYVFLDRYVALHADSIWPGALSILEGREADGRFKISEVNYRLAPMGNYSHIIFANGEVPFNRRELVYLGNANAKNVRADFLLDVAKYLVDKNEDFHITFIGPGSTEHLEQQAKRLGLESRVTFKGAIPVMIDLERLLSGCGIGLAPYDPNHENSFSRFGDPGKIKAYLGCGLPVITTDVPPIAKEVSAFGAGMIADFSVESFAQKIQNLWRDDKLFQESRSKARKMGEQYSWLKIFDQLLKDENLV